MQQEVDGEAQEDHGEERLVLVVLALEAHVRERSEQRAVDQGADREPEEGAAVGVSISEQNPKSYWVGLGTLDGRA